MGPSVRTPARPSAGATAWANAGTSVRPWKQRDSRISLAGELCIGSPPVGCGWEVRGLPPESQQDRVRSVRSLDGVVLTIWKMPRHPHAGAQRGPFDAFNALFFWQTMRLSKPGNKKSGRMDQT